VASGLAFVMLAYRSTPSVSQAEAAS